MNDLVGIVMSWEESQTLLTIVAASKGFTLSQESDLNAIYRRITEAQDLTRHC